MTLARIARLSPVALVSPLAAGCAAGSAAAPMSAVPASYVQSERADADRGFLNEN
jgi:hypothetical protein